MEEKEALKELSNQLSQSIYLSETCNSDGIAAINAKKAEFLSGINRIIQGQKNEILLLKHISEQMPKEMLALANANRKLESENAELKARLEKAVELPCKVGSEVYEIVLGTIEKRTVSGFAGGEEVELIYTVFEFDGKGYCRTFEVGDIGKTVFLTESEAQAKLDEMKGGAE